MTSNVKPHAIDEDAYPDELRPGTELLHGQYVIEKFLNSGGFGITYLAKDSLDRTVVIKECYPGSFCRRSDTIVCVRSRAHQNEFQSIVKLFVQEAKNLAKLKHPNIVGVHQIFEDNETAYMALDYVEGRDLLDILEDPNDAVAPADIQAMTHKLLGAVEYIHRAGVLHRDISPDNILLDRKTGEPVLIDFGAAREEATRQTRLLSAMRVVKDGYSPQEFYIQGSQQSPSSDLYALAATLYHLMTGECPPDSQSRLAAVAAQKADPYRAFPPEMSGYDPKFLKAINQAMNIFPYDRIQSASEWLKFITPEPEIVALPTKKVRPKRPTSVIADDSDLADHAAGGKAGKVEPPVPAMVQTNVDQAEKTQSRLNELRSPVAEPQKKSSMGLLLGGVAAAALIGVVGAVFVLPGGSETGGTPTETTTAQAPAAAPAPEAPVTEEVAVVEPTPEVVETPVVEEPVETVAATPEFVLDEPIAETTEIATAPAEVVEPVTTGPAALEELASLPAISLPTTTANDVQISEAAPATEVSAQPPVLSLENPDRFVEANDDALLAEQVQQAVVAALNPPKAPQIDSLEMLPKVAVLDEAPQIFAIIEPGEQTADGILSLLQAETMPDWMPLVDITTVEPLVSEKPEVVVAAVENGLIAPEDVSAVMTAWTVDLPFMQSPLEKNVVAVLRKESPDWLKTGTKIVAVNGVEINALDQIPGVVAETAQIEGNDQVSIQVVYQEPGEVTANEAVLPLQTARNVALLNGFEFKTVLTDGQWNTSVSVSPESGANALRAGDQLVAYIATNERLDREDTLSQIFERELSNGTSNFSFAVNRDGKLWVASLGYDGAAQNQ